MYVFPTMVAVDAAGQVLRSGVGQIFAEADTAGSTPLAIFDLNGLSLTQVAINDLGLTQAFQCEHPEVVWRSGSFTVPLASPRGLRQSAESAAAAALAAQAAAELAAGQVTEMGIPDDGNPGQFLGLDNEGNLSWFNVSGGGGSGIAGAPASWPSTFPPSDHQHTRAQISDATSIGRALMGAADQQAARAAIGAGTGNGTSNLTLGSASTQAAPGNHGHSATAITFTPTGSLTATNVQEAIAQAATSGGSGGGGTGDTQNIYYASGAYPMVGTPPAGVKKRVFHGPTPYTGQTYPGVLDFQVYAALT